MPSGVVKWFNKEKRFGFISMDPTGVEVFVLLSEKPPVGAAGLNEGDRVEFDAEAMPRGLRAKNVRKLGLTPAQE